MSEEYTIVVRLVDAEDSELREFLRRLGDYNAEYVIVPDENRLRVLRAAEMV